MIAIMDEQQIAAALREEVYDAIDAARAAQVPWAALSVGERSRRIGALRPVLAERTTDMARIAGSVSARPVAEKIASEVLPLLEACRFLEKNAARILRPRQHGWRGRPLWLHGSSFEVHRKPFGVVLIVGAGNYPLFIPAVQIIHALAAGNAVIVKPAEGASAPISAFINQILPAAGIAGQLVQILPETPEAAREALRAGVDKAIFTGSSQNGRRFLADLAKHNIPSVMELSGADAVYVRADADVELAVKAIEFGTRLNGGDTCMAPHAIVVHDRVADALMQSLKNAGIPTDAIFRVKSDAEALEVAAVDEHGLGAAVFSRDTRAAQGFAHKLPTGFVTINDIIVQTADPRLPFGGVRGSGFGTTRGAEGLLEMTYPQPIAVRRARFLPHLESPQAGDATLFAAFAAFAHGRGFAHRARAFLKLMKAGRARMRATAGSK